MKLVKVRFSGGGEAGMTTEVRILELRDNYISDDIEKEYGEWLFEHDYWRDYWEIIEQKSVGTIGEEDS